MHQLELTELILPYQASETDTPKGAVMQTPKNADAVFHLSVKTIKRSEGRSVLACAAYRAGCKMVGSDGSLIADYRRRKGVLFSEILAPIGAPTWALIRNDLWLQAASAEPRINSVEGREFEVAIPKGASQADAIALARRFGGEIVERHRCAVDFSLHADSRRNWDGSEKNFDGFHVHFLLSTRRIGIDGFNEKTRELDVPSSGEVTYWRRRWADMANEVLPQRGVCVQIDCRSNKARGIARKPSRPLGHEIVALERRGQRTTRGDEVREISGKKRGFSYTDPSV